MKQTFMAACIEFFGMKDGQSKLEFGREVQQLSNEDRKEIAAGLIKLGHEIDPATIENKNTKVKS